LRQLLLESKAAIEALIAQEEVLQQQRNQIVEQARVIGGLSLFIDSLRQVEDNSLAAKVSDLRKQVAELEESLTDDLMDDQLNSILQIIGRTMSIWSQRLDLEHSETPIGFDLTNPTVIAYKESGSIRMPQMGSGEKWMGYHVITHLALQKWFAEKNRPVPGLRMFYQPTQVYFPTVPQSDRSLNELPDDDRGADRRLFEFISEITASLSSKLQVILTDHADLNEDWFQAAVKERWRNGVRLVPSAWYEAEGSSDEAKSKTDSDTVTIESVEVESEIDTDEQIDENK